MYLNNKNLPSFLMSVEAARRFSVHIENRLFSSRCTMSSLFSIFALLISELLTTVHTHYM